MSASLQVCITESRQQSVTMLSSRSKTPPVIFTCCSLPCGANLRMPAVFKMQCIFILPNCLLNCLYLNSAAVHRSPKRTLKKMNPVTGSVVSTFLQCPPSWGTHYPVVSTILGHPLSCGTHHPGAPTVLWCPPSWATHCPVQNNSWRTTLSLMVTPC